MWDGFGSKLVVPSPKSQAMLEIMPADRLVNRTVNGATPFDESTRKLAIGGGIRVKVGVGLGATVAGRMAVGIGVGNRVLVGVGKTAMAVTTVGGSPVVLSVPPERKAPVVLVGARPRARATAPSVCR